MAPKRLKEDPPPATASSDEESENDAVSEEEEEEEENDVVVQEQEKSDDEEEGDDDEEEEEESEQEKLAVTPPPPSSKVSKPGSVSGSRSGSESDSETEISQASPSASDFTIKPIISKPMDDDDDVDVPLKPKKPNPTNGSNKPTSAPIKRAAAEIDPNPKDSKKKKPSTTTTNGDDEDPKKSSGVQRLWSEDDEIAVLKGMIDYQTKKGSDPYSDMAVFHEFIKKNLRVEVSKNQLTDKVRRLRKKYQNNADKGGENGADPVFNKPHDHKSFELSKKIWGIDNNNNSASVNNRKASRLAGKPNNNWPLALALPAKKEELSNGEVKNAVKNEVKNAVKNVVKNEEKSVVKNEERGFWESYPCLKESLEAPKGDSIMGSWYVKEEVVPTIENAKAKELERKWREMGQKQLELFVNKAELVYEQAKLMLEAMKKKA